MKGHKTNRSEKKRDTVKELRESHNNLVIMFKSSLVFADVLNFDLCGCYSVQTGGRKSKRN